MKRSRQQAEDVSDTDDNNFDDGDDLMARAAEMMDFDDDFEDSGSEEGSQSGSDFGTGFDGMDSGVDDDEDEDGSEDRGEGGSTSAASASKKQKAKDKKGKGKAREEDADPLEEDEEIRSVLQMQVDALISSIHCPNQTSSRARPLAACVERLTAILKAAPKRSASPALSAIQALQDPIPFQHPSVDLARVQWPLAFTPPSQIQLGGSWPVGASCKWKGKQAWNVDVLVEMPSDMFQEKDVKDFRYFYKRAFFLANLSSAIKNAGAPLDVTYAFLGGNRRRSILQVTPKGTGGDLDFAALRCTIRIIPYINQKSFPASLNRLHPSKNNLRSPDSTGDIPTPTYNSDLAYDATILETSETLQHLTNSSPTFAEAVMLLKVWANQRGYRTQTGLAAIGYILTVMLSHLVSGSGKGYSRLPASSSSWQLFKGCLEYLGKSDFLAKPLLAQGAMKSAHAPTEEDWIATKKPIMTDVTGISNILSEVPISSLELLRYDASVCLRAIRRSEAAAFTQCFLTLVDKPHLRFDHTARIVLAASAAKTIAATVRADASSDAASVLVKLSTALKRGLNDRVRCISISQDPTADDFPLQVTIGLKMEPTQIARVIEYGPPADSAEEVRRFRAFWGDKAETRRFKDGRILASVVWDAEAPSERSTIFVQTIRHLVERHLEVPKSSTHFFAEAYDDLVLEATQIRHLIYTDDPRVTGFGPVVAAYDSLVKELKGLQGLPLAINHVTPVSEALRYSSIFVPGAVKLKSLPYISTAANFCPVHDCIITFEGSGKWPEDLDAIQKIKAAFLSKIGQVFEEAVPGSKCEASVDLDAPSQGTNVALQIALPQGHLFRLRVHHPRERLLLESALLEDEMEDSERQVKQALLIQHHRLFTAQPSHHAAIAALQHRYTSFSATCRITKRWIAAHLLELHITPQVIELLCAKVYLDAESPYEVPSSGVVGFARVLDLLAKWKWREQPLTIPVYSLHELDASGHTPTFPQAKHDRVLRSFKNTRSLDPAINKTAWIVATEQDLTGKMWTMQGPSKLVAGRLQELARACSTAIAHQSVLGDSQVEHLFVPPLEAFDFILHLDPSKVARHRQALQPNFRALSTRPSKPQTIRPGFDGVSAFVERAKSATGDTVVLFYDPNGGLSLCGLFNPALTSKERDFRIALDYASEPVHKKAALANGDGGKPRAQVRLDRAAVVQRLVEMSEGLVKSVTMQENA